MLLQAITKRTGAQVYGPADATTIPSSSRRGDVIDIFIGCQTETLQAVQTVYELSSDHWPVLCKWGVTQKTLPTKQLRTDWSQFTQSIRISDLIHTWDDIESASNKFTSMVQKAVKYCTKEVSRSAQNRWGLDQFGKQAILEKNETRKQWLRTRTLHDKQQFRRAQRKVKEIISQRREEYLDGLVEEANENGTNPNFWRLYKKIGYRAPPNAPIQVEERLVFNDEEKAEELS